MKGLLVFKGCVKAMTGYERIQNVLHGKEVKPTPAMLHCFMAAAAEKGYTLSEYREDAKKIARSHIDFARKYGLDGVLIDVDTCMEAGALGVPVDLPLDDPARITTGLSSNIDECIDSMDVSKLYSYDRIKIKLDAVNRIKNEVGKDLLVRGNADQGPYSLAMLTLGMSEFMMQMFDNPEKVKILISRALEVHLQFHRMMIDAGADLTSFGDSSCGPDLISPAMYREFAFPFHKELARQLEKDSIPTVCHICGNLDLILEDVVSAGFPAIEIDYKTNVSRAHDIMKGKSVFFGPIDPSGVFYYGTPETMRRETKKVLDIFSDGGLVIGAGCALPRGVPQENIQAFVDTIRG
jgi:uroporphyrinogen decarboxylase